MLPQVISKHYKLCQYAALWLLPTHPVVGTWSRRAIRAGREVRGNRALQIDIAAPANEQGEGKSIWAWRSWMQCDSNRNPKREECSDQRTTGHCLEGICSCSSPRGKAAPQGNAVALEAMHLRCKDQSGHGHGDGDVASTAISTCSISRGQLVACLHRGKE